VEDAGGLPDRRLRSGGRRVRGERRLALRGGPRAHHAAFAQGLASPADAMKEALRLTAAVAVVVLAAVVFARLQAGKGYALQPGTPAPDFHLPLLAGGESGLSAYRGRPVLLNFWATWCPPCVDEMPSLQRLHKILEPEGLVVLSVSVDESGAALSRFVSEHGVTFPVLRDPGGRGAAASYHTTGYPETFL